MFPSSKSFRGAPLSGSSIKTPSTRFLKKPLKPISKTEFFVSYTDQQNTTTMKLKITLSFLLACMSSFFQGAYTTACACGVAVHQPVVSAILGVITISFIVYGALKLKEL